MIKLRAALMRAIHRHACIAGMLAGGAIGCTAASAGTTGPGPVPSVDLVELTGDPTWALLLGGLLQVMMTSPGWAAIGLIGYAVIRHGMPSVPLQVDLVLRAPPETEVGALRQQLEELRERLEDGS